MNFYEQELKKIVGDRYQDATYVGRACYVRLSDTNRAKIQFVTGIVANHYNALQLTILNRNEGQVDVLRLRFTDLLGKKQTNNPNFCQVEAPRVDCKVLSKLTGGTQFVNQADAGGVYNGQWIMATSRWVTRVYAPSKPLPRTGY